MEGANTRIVRTTSKFKLVTNCSGESGALKLKFIVGIASAPTSKLVLKSKSSIKILFNYFAFDEESSMLFSALSFVLLSIEKK